MNEFGRIAVCGAISTYNQNPEEQPKGDHNYYCTLAKEGPWAVHLTLGQYWGMGRYQYRIYTRKSAQVIYPR